MNQKIQKQCIILGMCLLLLLVVFIYQKGLTRETGVGETSKQNEVGLQAATETEIQTERSKEKDREEKRQVKVVVPGGNPKVRVLICADNYEGEYHNSLTLQCSTDYTVSYGDTVEEHKASEPVWFTLDDPWLAQGAVTLTPKEETGEFTLPDLKRAQAAPSYTGIFVIEKKEQGLLVINELPLETYLRSVVPSEMPSDYPLEALKAQAVCARTYALKQLQGSRAEDKGADLDDSVSYQVYNNIAKNEKTDQAVEETAGQVLMQGGELVDALYYSTSCGIDLSQNLSDEAVFCSFMSNGSEKAYEKEEPWYRWSTYYSLEELTRLVQTGWQSDFGTVTGMSILSRENNGAIQTLALMGDGGEIQVEGEYTIRKLLRTDNAQVTLQDGTTAPNLGMLPSAFFYLTPEYEGNSLKGYTLTGGGYGHGNGMSQNGARHMADAGKHCEEILSYYYGDISVSVQ